jgi:hypothetical protein
MKKATNSAPPGLGQLGKLPKTLQEIRLAASSALFRSMTHLGDETYDADQRVRPTQP